MKSSKPSYLYLVYEKKEYTRKGTKSTKDKIREMGITQHQTSIKKKYIDKKDYLFYFHHTDLGEHIIQKAYTYIQKKYDKALPFVVKENQIQDDINNFVKRLQELKREKSESSSSDGDDNDTPTITTKKSTTTIPTSVVEKNIQDLSLIENKNKFVPLDSIKTMNNVKVVMIVSNIVNNNNDIKYGIHIPTSSPSDDFTVPSDTILCACYFVPINILGNLINDFLKHFQIDINTNPLVNKVRWCETINKPELISTWFSNYFDKHISKSKTKLLLEGKSNNTNTNNTQQSDTNSTDNSSEIVSPTPHKKRSRLSEEVLHV